VQFRPGDRRESARLLSFRFKHRKVWCRFRGYHWTYGRLWVFHRFRHGSWNWNRYRLVRAGFFGFKFFWIRWLRRLRIGELRVGSIEGVVPATIAKRFLKWRASWADASHLRPRGECIMKREGGFVP
jgi:hypothetical protein